MLFGSVIGCSGYCLWEGTKQKIYQFITSKYYAILKAMLFSALTSMNFFLVTVREHAIKQ